MSRRPSSTPRKEAPSAGEPPRPLYRREYEAAALMASHPPRWSHPHKRLVAELSCPPGARHSGAIVVSRWSGGRPPSQLSTELHRTELDVRPDIFDYRPVLPPLAVEWHLNFAASDLFCAYGGGLFAQDEMQVTEHPALGAVREALLAEGLSTFTVEGDRPTPILVRGVERRCRVRIDPNPAEGRPYGLYGNNFARAPASAIRAAVEVIDPPTISNIIAIEAPSYGSGRYRLEEIRFILETAWAGWSAAVEDSRAAAADPSVPVVIHTGFWGCGAYGGNRTLMALLQLLAARLAGIRRLVFHTVNRDGLATVADAERRLNEMIGGRREMPLDDLFARIEAAGFEWGVSDGN